MALCNDDTQVVLSLFGNATGHADINDVLDLTFVFSDLAFATLLAADVVNAAGACQQCTHPGHGRNLIKLWQGLIPPKGEAGSLCQEMNFLHH